MKRWIGLAMASASVLGPASAKAQTPPTGAQTIDRAEQLYVEAKRLAAEGSYADACPKFEESQRLEPAIGTQFNLADCLEKTGKPATALLLFREVSKVAQMSGKQERQRAAAERIAMLETTVPRIRVKITTPPPANEIVAWLDGKVVEADDVTRGMAVDPGPHSVRVEASGYKPWSTTITIAIAAPGAAPTVEELAPPPLEKVATTIVVASTPTEPPPSRLRPLAIGLMAVGGIGLVTGSIFGLSAISSKNAAVGCSGANCAAGEPGSGDKIRDAQSAGTASTIFFVVGGVLAASGIVLFFAAPRGAPRATAWATPSGGGMRWEQSF